MTKEKAQIVIGNIPINPEVLDDCYDITEYQEAKAMAIQALAQTRWIPVSEKLPEDYIHVLCQFTLGGMGECYLAHGLFHVIGGVRMLCDEVIAWMPLPEPYKEDSNE